MSEATAAANSTVSTPAPVRGLRPDSTLRVEDLTITPHVDGFVVGHTDTERFVVLPEIGVRALRCLRSGLTVQETSRAVTPTDAAEPVDVLDFARSLVTLGFATDQLDWSPHTPAVPERPGVAWSPRPRFTWLFSLPAAYAAAAAAAAAIVLLIALPAIRPQSDDVFFLSTPARSLAALTLITYVLAFVHEMAHVYAAAALGVSARLRITRRLYFLTFETNLTGLWALPARRRIGPLLAGMAFDTFLFLCTLALRAAHLGPDRLLAAIALIELFAIVTQFFVFLRTDVYAVMTALLGCTNLALITRLTLRRMLRLLSVEQRATLAAGRPRDLAVARWYQWIHLAGLGLAGWFLFNYFLPSTWHLLQWMWQATTGAGPANPAFYEAVLLGLLLISPRVLTLVVAIREAFARRSKPPHPPGRTSP